MKPALKSILIVILCLTVCATFAGTSQKAKKKSRAKPKQSHVVQKDAVKPTQKSTANYGQYDFTLSTLDGKTIHLSDYAGKVVLVNIWAPWCGPCKAETPGFVKLYNEYHAKGFEIIGVAANTNESDVRSFMQKYNITWPTGLNDDIAIAYQTYGLPDSYLFNAGGGVIKHFVGFARDDVVRAFVEGALKDVKP